MARPPRRPVRRGEGERKGDGPKAAGKAREGQPAPRKGRPTRSAKEERAPKRWGGVARGAVRRLDEPVEGSAAAAWQAAVEATRRGRRAADGPAREEWQPERLEQLPEGPAAVRAAKSGPPPAGARRARKRAALPEQIGAELRRTGGSGAARL